MQVVFIHPDLGIGGAERLVVDAAVALKNKGHRVSFITGHHDRKHCFEETKNGTFSVTAVGRWIPRHLFGAFHALLSYLKMIYLALYLIFISRLKPDVIFCDQISICIPFLRWGTSAKVVFYCHFPDKLLTQRKTFLKSLYRKPLDWVEEKTTGMAHLLLVNSHFTARTFRDAFPSLKHIETHVLHPSLNIATFNNFVPNLPSSIDEHDPKWIFVSINRYERKKNIRLAIEALDRVHEKLSDEEWRDVHLVIAGGYDNRVKENTEHYLELERLTDALQLSDKVTFLRSISDSTKKTLLQSACAVLYTPDNEHYGIVPVEAMFMKSPVIAVNSGGPVETVVHGQTGFLCQSDPDEFADAMLRLVREEGLAGDLGEAGKRRVESEFSLQQFGTLLCGIIQSIMN